MKHGFISVSPVTMDIKLGNVPANAEAICEQMRSKPGVNVMVFPELCLTGATCGDLFGQQKLLDACFEGLVSILRQSKKRGFTETLYIVGAPCQSMGKIYNCAFVIQDGAIKGIVPKTNVQTVCSISESRVFSVHKSSVNGSMDTIMLPVGRVQLTADGNGDEIWRVYSGTVPFGVKLLFTHSRLHNFRVGVEIGTDLDMLTPMSVNHVKYGATVICNLGSAPAYVGSQTLCVDKIRSHSARLSCGYVYANAGEGESTTDNAYVGFTYVSTCGKPAHKNVLDVEAIQTEKRKVYTDPTTDYNDYTWVTFGEALTETDITGVFQANPYYQECLDNRVFEDTLGGNKMFNQHIFDLQVSALVTRLRFTHSKKVILGLSGGLDSTLAVLVAVQAMRVMNRPATDVVAISMPGFGTTGRTKNNAQELAELLGVTYREISIRAAVEQHFVDIEHDADNHNTVYENAQARERTQILMDVANQMGGLVLGTGNLSEIAQGWCTFNADHMSMYSINAGIPKTVLRDTVLIASSNESRRRKENKRNLTEVLMDILTTPVSPELLPLDAQGGLKQTTENSIGPYELHDFFLYYIIKYGFTPAKVCRMAQRVFEDKYDAPVIANWLGSFLSRFFNQQFKRSVMPDGPNVLGISLSPRGSWVMPSDMHSTVWLEEMREVMNTYTLQG